MNLLWRIRRLKYTKDGKIRSFGLGKKIDKYVDRSVRFGFIVWGYLACCGVLSLLTGKFRLSITDFIIFLALVYGFIHTREVYLKVKSESDAKQKKTKTGGL